jgi:hypothetical protein
MRVGRLGTGSTAVGGDFDQEKMERQRLREQQYGPRLVVRIRVKEWEDGLFRR